MSTPFKMKGYSYPGTSPMQNKGTRTGKTIPVTRPGLITKHAPPANKQKEHTLEGKTGFEYDMIPVTNVLNKFTGAASGALKGFNTVKDGVNKANKEIVNVVGDKVRKAYKYFTEK